MSFTKADLEAIALLKPVTANSNKINIDALVAKAHYERSLYLRKLLANTFGKLIAAYRTNRANKNTIRELQGLSDLELHDIGVSRGGIKRAVLGEAAEHVSFGAKVKNKIASLMTSFQNRQISRAGYHQLMAMDSRQLSDIGLTRGDIAAAISGKAALANDNAVRPANNNGGRQVS